MLFRKNIEKSCDYCIHGTALDEETVLCIKKGVVKRDGKCRKFSYDPCKRTPVKAKAPNFEKYKEQDYSL